MLLLPCANCSFNNVVKSELLTFCSNCGKKLDNSYSSWQAKYPNRTLKDWYEQVCIDTDKKQTVNYRRNHPPANKTKMLLIIATGFVLASGIIYYAAKNIYPKVKTAFIESQWKKLTYGALGLYIETPDVLLPYQEKLTDDILKSLQRVEYYKSRDGATVTITLTNAQYNEDIVANVDGSAQAIINSFKNEKTNQHFNYTQQPVQINGYNAVQVSGSYIKDGDDISFQSLIAGKANYLYIVNIAYFTKNMRAKNIAQHIAKSIAIKRENSAGY
ncbi:MAG: hypothetical protein ABI723_13410 [Bacteroidia bacterium]